MRSDELFVFMFVSLKMVAYYGNYTLIVSRIGQLFSAILDSINAGIGNLIAEGNKENILKVFWEMITIRHFVAGILCFTTYHFVEPFISVWLGPQYILDRNIVALLSIFIYISSSRGVVDMYNHAHGLYADTWSAWAELMINISITIVAGIYWGIIGILLGKIISTGIIIVLWKPYYLFHSGLNKSYKYYWKGVSRNYLVSVISFISSHHIISIVNIVTITGYMSWAIYCTFSLCIYLIINIILTITCCYGASSCLIRIKRIIKK